MKNKNWFEVSKEGLKELQAGKPKHFIVRELVQNAWDEKTSHCKVELKYSEGVAEISVLDDSPEGFKDLADAFTLFKHTDKRSEPEQRGRFNIGEKQAIALASKAKIITTKGTIIFDKDGRQETDDKTKAGSKVILWVKMEEDELEEIAKMLDRYIPPKEIEFVVNGRKKLRRARFATVETSLETELEDKGIMRKVFRKTEVKIYKTIDDKAMLYEMGIPVCEVACQFDIDVQQKVPLSIDRETVSQKYLSNLYAEVLNVTFDLLDQEDISQLWVRDALSNKRIKKDAVKDIILKRFGDKVCVANPFDPNSIDEAISRGYNVVYGSELSGEEWSNIKRDGLMSSSTELFGKDFTNAEVVEPNENQKEVAKLAKKIAKRVLKIDLKVSFVKGDMGCSAQYSDGVLTFNLSNLVESFWEKPLSKEVLSLIQHELAHSKGNHTEMAYHECLTDMASELIIIALEEPKFFKQK